jgi:transcriptional regulator with XRE-family HTH domain
LRERAGLSQVALAELLGVSQSFVTKYEVGQRRLDLFQLRQVCDVLGVKLSTLAAEFDS